MHHRQSLGRAALAAVLLSLLLVVAAAAPGAGGKSPENLRARRRSSRSPTPARAKLDKGLRALVEKGATKRVFVYATAKSDAAAAAAALLRNGRYANAGDISLVVGSLRVTAATKLAGLPGVISVKLVQLKQTASPLGIPEPNLNQAPSKSSLQSAMNDLRQQEVPYSAAPAPRGSNFDRLKQLGVLDAKTHKFADAWNQGFAGEGTTVSILDGGTDWAHPDLLNTWQTWSGATDSVRHGRRLERMAEGLRPVRHAGLAPRPRLRRPGAHLVHADDGEELVHPELSGQEGESSARQLRDARRPVAQLQRAGRDGLALLHVPEGLDEVRDRPHGEPSGRPSAPALRRAPCDSRHRPEHGGRLRHGLRGSRRRLPVRRREARHESIAGLVPRHERGRLQRPLGRPSLLHLGRRDCAAGRHHALHGRLAGVP